MFLPWRRGLVKRQPTTTLRGCRAVSRRAPYRPHVERLECRLVPSGPPSIRIDNGIPAGTVGQFAIEVENGGRSTHGGVTAQGTTQRFVDANFIFEFANFVDVGSDGGAMDLSATTILTPATLVSGAVVSTGSFAGQNGTVNWRVETRIDPGSPIIQNIVSFTSAQPLGNLRFINYLDEDVAGFTDDILYRFGTPGQPNFLAFTLDNPERVGFGHGGVYAPGAQLVGATYDGWAADEFAFLINAITGAGTTYSVAGNINQTRLPPFTDPELGQVFGPRDVTTAHAWTVNPAATTATITTFLRLLPQNTTTVLESSANPSVFGQPVTFTATVRPGPSGTGTPTGTVTFTDGETALATVPLGPAGTATFTTALLTVGSHPITAVYSGDPTFNPSTSPALSQVVNRADTNTALASSANPSVFGQPVTFTATVTAVAPGAGVPGGTVTFHDGATALTTVPLGPGGQASFTTSALAVGSHPITAEYSGNTNFNASTSAPLSQTVNRGATATAVSAAPAASVFGQAVTFTATVTVQAPAAGTPTGSVTFRDGAATLGTAPLGAGGQAVFTTSSLASGPHAITAVYGGDANFDASTSAPLSQTVNQGSTATSLTSSLNPSLFGQPVTFTATVTVQPPAAGTPAGNVAFMIDGLTLSGLPLGPGGQATFTTASLGPGTHAVAAVYSGDANFQGSSSAPLAQTVGRGQTAVRLTVPDRPSVWGQEVALTAFVTPQPPAAGAPSGTVVFRDGETVLGSGTIVSGQAVLRTRGLAPGTHGLTAEYQGDGAFFPSPRSAAVAFTVECTANQAYVVALYHDVMQRQQLPAFAEVDFWASRLDAGLQRDALATFFWMSPEHRGVEVDQFYRTFFKRPADGPGRQFWVNMLLRGVQPADVVVGFLTAGEYQANHASNTAFVRGLYEDVLGGPGNPADVALNAGLLDNGARTRTQLVLTFLSSDDAYRQAVSAYYDNFLRRGASTPELQGWLQRLRAGQFTPTTLSVFFLTSPEYRLRAEELACRSDFFAR